MVTHAPARGVSPAGHVDARLHGAGVPAAEGASASASEGRKAQAMADAAERLRIQFQLREPQSLQARRAHTARRPPRSVFVVLQ